MGLSMHEKVITLHLLIFNDKLFWRIHIINLSKFACNFTASDGE